MHHLMLYSQKGLYPHAPRAKHKNVNKFLNSNFIYRLYMTEQFNRNLISIESFRKYRFNFLNISGEIRVNFRNFGLATSNAVVVVAPTVSNLLSTNTVLSFLESLFVFTAKDKKK